MGTLNRNKTILIMPKPKPAGRILATYINANTLRKIADAMGYKRRIRVLYTASDAEIVGDAYPESISVGNELCSFFFFEKSKITVQKSEVVAGEDFDVDTVANQYAKVLNDAQIHPAEEGDYWENLCIFCQSTPTHFHIWLAYYQS